MTKGKRSRRLCQSAKMIAFVRRSADNAGAIFHLEAQGAGPELQQAIAESDQPSRAPAFDFQGVDDPLSLLVLPAIGARIRQSDLIENAPDDGVGHVARPNAAGCRTTGSQGSTIAPASSSVDDVARVNQTPGRFARDQDQLAALLQENIGGAQERAVAPAGSDPAERCHRAGDDHHRVEAGGAADERNIEIILAVLRHACLERRARSTSCAATCFAWPLMTRCTSFAAQSI